MPPISIIRLAGADDAASVQAIYAPSVRDTPISFELEPPSVEEMQHRIETILVQFPWLVCEHRGEVIGYVYASAHNSRAAYRWGANLAVYIDRRCHRSGVGKALYASLFQILILQGYYNAYAGITLPNAASVGLHEEVGFELVGVYAAAGYKLGGWHDVGWWQMALRERPRSPAQPVSILEVQRHAGWHAALDAGLPFLKV